MTTLQATRKVVVRPSIPLTPTVIAPPMREKFNAADVQKAIRIIANEACEMLGVTFEELTGKVRHCRVTLARRLVVVVAKTYTTASYPDITRIIRPTCTMHTTCLTAHQKFNRVGHSKIIWWCGDTLTGNEWLAKLERKLQIDTKAHKSTDSPC